MTRPLTGGATGDTTADIAPSTFMAEALRLANGVLGTTSPNPAVGAVVVRDGRIIGRGATQPPTPGPGYHAEVMALRDAGSASRGSTVYVTLEPCAHHGRTPPCTDALINAGVTEVVIAAGDPDRHVDGNGMRRLRDAAVSVRTGDGAAEAMLHYEAYAHHRRTGRPFVTAKYAASLDGKIGATSGDSRWISGPEARAWAHQQRPKLDAILVGADTIILDNPQLTARPGGSSSGVPPPLRIVLDSRGRIDPAAQVLQEQNMSKTLIATTPLSPQAWRDAVSATGATVAVFQPPNHSQNNRVPLPQLLDRLGADGVLSLLVEGGGRVLGSFFDEGLIDKVHAIIAPMIIGGDAAAAVIGKGAERMEDAVRLRDIELRQISDDLLVTGYPIGAPPSENVILRIAGDEDLGGYLALVDDPAHRLELEPLLTASVAGTSRDGGNCWVAIVPAKPGTPGSSEQIVGAISVVWHDQDWEERADGRRRAGLQHCLVAPLWRPHGLGTRLVETVEAAAEARGFSYLSALPAHTPSSPSRNRSAAADASGLTPEAWRARGFRYYRRTRTGTALRIKALSPDPHSAAERLHRSDGDS